MATQCGVAGCDRPIHRASGYCRRHHYRLITHGDPEGGGPLRNTQHELICTVPGCDKPYLAKGLCSTHYARRAAHGDPMYQREHIEKAPCVVRGCSNLQKAAGYCGMHYQRAKKHGDPEKSLRGPIGKGGMSTKGYRILYLPDHPNASKTGRIPEHRFVMSEMLGRPLLASETVHHKNGNKLDNRPENLELWVQNHMSGQRVDDLLQWARDVIARYSELEQNAHFQFIEADSRRD